MTDTPMPLQFIYLTLPDSEQPVLNIRVADSGEMYRFFVSRRQLRRLLAEFGDANWREPQ